MISNLLFKLRSLNEDVELISILIFLIFFPEKSSFYYFMIFAVLMITFLIRKIIISKNIGISNFTRALLLVNTLLLVSTIFSVYFFKSLLFFFDVFLISAYFILHLIEEKEEERNIKIFGTIISVFSFISIIIFLFSDTRDLFFLNPIMAGITSGIGSLIFLYYFLKKINYTYLSLIFLNLAALYISQSKAAFLGVAIFSLLLVLTKNKKAIPVILILILLTFIIPNPIRSMFHFSIYEDPYSADRLQIWNTGLKIFRDNIFSGSGADNFSELSKTYNFKQKYGPANYFKIPRMPHSDYIKMISELGLWGIFILSFSLFFILRRILKGPLFNISKILILYLLFQSLFFNIIFQTFFFFLFIFLLKILFKGEIYFFSNSNIMKFISVSILIIIIFTGYVFPYYSELLAGRGINQKDLVTIFDSLKRAGKFNRQNLRPYNYRAILLLEQFRKTSDPVYFYSALDNVKSIKKINPYFSKAYFLESDIFRTILEKGMHYPGLSEEIITPLEQLEKIDPFNPFIKMEKAHILLKFNKPESAKAEAIRAIELEPDYISALYFLQKNFNYFGKDELFNNKIRKILRSTSNWVKRKSQYLDALIKLPPELTGLLKDATSRSD